MYLIFICSGKKESCDYRLQFLLKALWLPTDKHWFNEKKQNTH